MRRSGSLRTPVRRRKNHKSGRNHIYRRKIIRVSCTDEEGMRMLNVKNQKTKRIIFGAVAIVLALAMVVPMVLSAVL